MGKHIGNKKNRDLRIENMSIFNYYRDRLLAAALAQFEWENLPDTCDSLYFERSLIFNGQAAIYSVEGSPDTWLSTGFVFNSGFNVYGYPTQIKGVGYNQANIPVDQFVVCYDNVMKETLLPHINFWAKQLYETHNTFRSNLRHQNKPYIVKADKNTLLTVRNFFNNMFGYDPVIEVRPGSFDANNIESVDLKVDFKGKELLDCLQTQWKDALSFLGITEGTAKKERMIEDEVMLNRMGDMVSLETRMKTRRDFCERFNRATGMNISVRLSAEEFDLVPYNESDNNNIEEEGDV